MLVKNEYQFKLVKRQDGNKPPRLTLEKLAQMMQDGFDKISQRIDRLEKVVIRDYKLLIETNQFLHKIIKLNNLKTK